MFGIGASRAFAGEKTKGRVTKVTPCYWLKVNTKPVRAHAGDGALYPHIICFTYRVQGLEYTGKRYVHWNRRCPVKDEEITVYYERQDPGKYALIV